MRILLKLSGEALAGEKKTGFDEETVRKVALQVKQLVDDGCQVHLLEHVYVVVAGAAVGAQRNVQAHVQHLLHRSEAASELHVA